MYYFEKFIYTGLTPCIVSENHSLKLNFVKNCSTDIQMSNVKELYCYNEKIENLSREQG